MTETKMTETRMTETRMTETRMTDPGRKVADPGRKVADPGRKVADLGTGDLVKVDLVIDETPDGSNGSSSESQDPPEVLVLRILSSKTRFKFGGLEVSVKSPAFEVGKTFAVSLDENNVVAGIEVIEESRRGENSSRATSPSRPTPASSASSAVSCQRRISHLTLKPARIIVNPSDESDSNRGLHSISGRISILELPKVSESEVSESKVSKVPSPKTNCGGGNEGSEEPVIMRYGTSEDRSRCVSPSRPELSFSSSGRPELSFSSSGRPELSFSSSGRPVVSVGIGTTSHPRESLYFDLASTLRRSKSWRK